MNQNAIPSYNSANSLPAPWQQFASLLSDPVLLVDEKRVDYERIRNQIFISADPQDGIEVVLLVQFVDNFWEGLRQKRLRIKFIRSSESQGVNQLLALRSSKESQEIAMKWMRGEKSAIRYVDSMLKNAGLDREAITAQTVGLFIEKLSAFDRIIANRESAQTKALAALYYHREMFGRCVSKSALQIEDREISEVIANERSSLS